MRSANNRSKQPPAFCAEPPVSQDEDPANPVAHRPSNQITPETCQETRSLRPPSHEIPVDVWGNLTTHQPFHPHAPLPMNVLVVDDDPGSRKLMQALLSKAGYEASLQVNATQGFAAATAADAPPIIVLDWMLPDMDGPTLCRKIVDARCDNPAYIFFLSARASKDDLVRGFDAGADDYLAKPLNAAEFVSRLRVARRWIERLPTRHPGHAAEAAVAGSARATTNDSSLPKPTAPWTEPADFSDLELGHFGRAALRDLQLTLDRTSAVDEPSLDGADFLGWSSCLITSHDTWLDVSVAGHAAVLSRLHERRHRRKAQGQPELEALAADLAQALTQALQRCLLWRNATVRSLFPCAGHLLVKGHLPPIDVGSGTWHELIVESEPLRLALHAHRCPVRAIPPENARMFDILDAPFPLPEVSEVPIFNAGSVLTSRFVDKLAAFADEGDASGNIHVRRPSPLSVFFVGLSDPRLRERRQLERLA